MCYKIWSTTCGVVYNDDDDDDGDAWWSMKLFQWCKEKELKKNTIIDVD